MSYDEERLGELLRLLPEVPEGWVRAAQELPAARAALDTLVARAEADAAERERIVADLEAALVAEGVEAHVSPPRPAPRASRAVAFSPLARGMIDSCTARSSRSSSATWSARRRSASRSIPEALQGLLARYFERMKAIVERTAARWRSSSATR